MHTAPQAFSPTFRPRLHFRDFHWQNAEAVRSAFADVPEVEASQGNLLSLTGDAIVSPANSFGSMDGGFDLALSLHFGWELERRLRAKLLAEHDGELPVGQALLIPTENPQVPWLISAPTMRVPQNIADTTNVYLAFRALLQAVRLHNQTSSPPIQSILCPGLGTGEGRMAPERSARQMRMAWEAIVEGNFPRKGGLARAVENHMDLLA